MVLITDSCIMSWTSDHSSSGTLSDLILWIFLSFPLYNHKWKLEKTPGSPLDNKEIKPVNLKGNQPWIFVGRTDAEAETPVFWSSDANSCLTGKVPDAGKDWGKKRRVSEDERAGCHHCCNGRDLGQTSGDAEGQRSFACYSPWRHKESDSTGWLNNNNMQK